MDAATQAWLISQLGTTTDLTDLTTRYTRLGTARAVALEILNQRLADLRADVAKVAVSSVVSVDYTANILAYERQIAALESGGSPAPDEPAGGIDPDAVLLGTFQLVERRRR
ncbi:hypothetical protein [Streptomyces cylindrosporus]|uniref:Uncharacterized protein n=1 Tax=Streptomyces cylindrosporus TaxID=2927583 RepID=A0ABS9YPA4_9ACTN|nr:hypothetical protein [Streptomyces cylindrosporus]MCI3279097.1 hypothetical protein [Streptomyces cylindrosporus]